MTSEIGNKSVSVKGAADRTAGSQCQSEVAHPKSAHTPGPRVGTFKVMEEFHGKDGYSDVLHGPGFKATIPRIVACVNACEGYTNEELAAHSYGDAVTHYRTEASRIQAQRDELAAALKSCVLDLAAERPGCVRLSHYRAILSKAGAAP